MDDIYVDQLSIFLENKEGRMLNTLDIIENLGVNIRALSIADTSEFGIPIRKASRIPKSYCICNIYFWLYRRA